ncbi:uncharacterized protein LOC119882029 [Micropterus salmoides]|uniref:uncharacterized protein LOC119882029 n=1 Tax=Micropterus salmoides TaxID=27706 RepID=UPI0018ECE582|nr:uncharacterized protein LOC119882029 [Micropterus salmoides]
MSILMSFQKPQKFRALNKEPQNVLCEDDIIGVRASIVYENCLRQLATFLILPVDKCTGLLRTGAPCNCVAPFEINITTKGTAATIEWICPNGDSLWRWNSQPVMKFGMQAGDFLLYTNILLSGNNYAKVALLFKFMNMGMVNRNTFFSIQDSYCVNTIKDFWEERRTEVLCRLQGKDVVVLEMTLLVNVHNTAATPPWRMTPRRSFMLPP